VPNSDFAVWPATNPTPLIQGPVRPARGHPESSLRRLRQASRVGAGWSRERRPSRATSSPRPMFVEYLSRGVLPRGSVHRFSGCEGVVGIPGVDKTGTANSPNTAPGAETLTIRIPSLRTSTAPLLRTSSRPSVAPAVSTVSPARYFMTGRPASLSWKAAASGTRGTIGLSFGW